MESYIQKIKFCPHCGVQYKPENFDKTGSFKCDSCKFRNFVKSFPSITAIIPNIENSKEILMVKRLIEPGIGTYDPPGGFVNYDEEAKDAVLREVEEELGLKLEIVNILSVGKNSHPIGEIVYPTIPTIFLLKPISLSSIKLNEENSKAEFFNIERILNREIKLLWQSVFDAIVVYSKSL